jgi:hypothetical protein
MAADIAAHEFALVVFPVRGEPRMEEIRKGNRND